MSFSKKSLLKEYYDLESVFGKFFMSFMFNDFSGYMKVREENTFFEIRDSLSLLVVENFKN
jgi:hypothetical protein